MLFRSADFDGVMGRLNCNTFGDCGSGSFSMVRFDDVAAGIEGLRSNVIYTHKMMQ